MSKSPDAFRTISEVAEWLDRPAHVLRFWESKFTQVKPIKRAGGRRYYRPEDMLLLGGIKKLLHDDGLTIKGVQKLLREEGIDYVSELSQPLDIAAETGALVPSPEKVATLKQQAETPETAKLFRFPSAENPSERSAERELSSSSYEDAVKDYAAEPDIELPKTADAPDAFAEEQPTVPEAEAEAEADTAFQAPSFFDMFEQVKSEAAPTEESSDAENPPASGLEPEVSLTTETLAEAPLPQGPTPVPTPKVIEVPTDAVSDAGPGILSRIMAARQSGRTVDTVAVRDLRASVSHLKSRLSAN